MDLDGLLEEAIQDLRETRFGVAIAFVQDGATSVRLSEGADGLSSRSRFEIGSVTKPLTALLLAVLAEDGAVRLDTTVADVLGPGPNGVVTLEQLATHTSGLPRLPPNLMVKAAATPDNPYSTYGPEDVCEAVASEAYGPPGDVLYSNFGFMLLGHLLSVATGESFPPLLIERVLVPLGMDCARVGGGDDPERVPGYAGNRPVPHWDQPLPGAGGVEASLDDMVELVLSSSTPTARPSPLRVRSTQVPRADTVTGAVVLTNRAPEPPPDRIGFRLLEV